MSALQPVQLPFADVSVIFRAPCYTEIQLEGSYTVQRLQNVLNES